MTKLQRDEQEYLAKGRRLDCCGHLSSFHASVVITAVPTSWCFICNCVSYRRSLREQQIKTEVSFS